jgi:hypothetical protein
VPDMPTNRPLPARLSACTASRVSHGHLRATHPLRSKPVGPQERAVEALHVVGEPFDLEADGSRPQHLMGGGVDDGHVIGAHVEHEEIGRRGPAAPRRGQRDKGHARQDDAEKSLERLHGFPPRVLPAPDGPDYKRG